MISWNIWYFNVLVRIHFSLFESKKVTIWVCIYMNDILITSKKQNDIDNSLGHVRITFDMHGGGQLSEYLAITI